ncbi:hypothetical protein PV682_31995 [Streptomyces niveiscabiei]|uniref:hypothetical protein n=1 Tax=Streptomyces niveiscabiei TaxID=164115 RepID=UPI0029A9F45D|nr:hypothetical protein [Streptomyces niveiscabiei]MDX3386046.1 hypothetical protein [Streptomyces niveiscabiei]
MRSVAVTACWTGYPDPPGELLAPGERALLQGLPAWRRRETALGRITAHAALRLLHGPHRTGAWTVLRAPSGAPRVVGARAVVSIAHCGDVVTAVAGTAGPLGIDVERAGSGPHPLPRCRAPEARCLDPMLEFACQEAAVKAYHDSVWRLEQYRVRPSRGRLHVLHEDGVLRVWPHLFAGHFVVIAAPPGSRPEHRPLEPHQVTALEGALP